jgi:aspartate carbamoyltransferase catalytic subunit
VGCYSDVIVLRHPQVGSSYEAAHYLDTLRSQIARKPVVLSGGDGVGEHPSQALLDCFTIYDFKGQIDGQNITLVGDLKNGRTVHSLAKLIARYEAQGTIINLVAPHVLQMPKEVVAFVQSKGIKVQETDNLYDVLPDSDVIYWTRVQEERFKDQAEYDATGQLYHGLPGAQGQADAILMHPLPRLLPPGLKSTPIRAVFPADENGMFVRSAAGEGDGRAGSDAQNPQILDPRSPACLDWSHKATSARRRWR